MYEHKKISDAVNDGTLLLQLSHRTKEINRGNYKILRSKQTKYWNNSSFSAWLMSYILHNKIFEYSNKKLIKKYSINLDLETIDHINLIQVGESSRMRFKYNSYISILTSPFSNQARNWEQKCWKSTPTPHLRQIFSDFCWVTNYIDRKIKYFSLFYSPLNTPLLSPLGISVLLERHLRVISPICTSL